MSSRNFTKPAGKKGVGGYVRAAAYGRVAEVDAIWTDEQRELFYKASLKAGAIDLAKRAVDALEDDMCILFLEMVEAKIPKGRICELYGIANVTLNNMLVQGDSIRALRAVEGK